MAVCYKGQLNTELQALSTAEYVCDNPVQVWLSLHSIWILRFWLLFFFPFLLPAYVWIYLLVCLGQPPSSLMSQTFIISGLAPSSVIYCRCVPKENISEGQMGRRSLVVCQDKQWLMPQFKHSEFLVCMYPYSCIFVPKGGGVGASIDAAQPAHVLSCAGAARRRAVCVLVIGFLHQNRLKELQGLKTVIRWQFCW